MVAQAKGFSASVWQPRKIKHRTSVGNGPNSEPANKQKRRAFKKYRGQGR